MTSKMVAIAPLKDPEKMAHVLYFCAKTYPNSIFKRNFPVAISNTAQFLKRGYGWKFIDITRCCTILAQLTKYMRMSNG